MCPLQHDRLFGDSHRAFVCARVNHLRSSVIKLLLRLAVGCIVICGLCCDVTTSEIDAAFDDCCGPVCSSAKYIFFDSFWSRSYEMFKKRRMHARQTQSKTRRREEAGHKYTDETDFPPVDLLIFTTGVHSSCMRHASFTFC